MKGCKCHDSIELPSCHVLPVFSWRTFMNWSKQWKSLYLQSGCPTSKQAIQPDPTWQNFCHLWRHYVYSANFKYFRHTSHHSSFVTMALPVLELEEGRNPPPPLLSASYCTKIRTLSNPYIEFTDVAITGGGFWNPSGVLWRYQSESNDVVQYRQTHTHQKRSTKEDKGV